LNGLLGGVSNGTFIVSGTLNIGTVGYSNGLQGYQTAYGWPSSPSSFTFSSTSLITGSGLVTSSSSSNSHYYFGVVNIHSFYFLSGPSTIASGFAPSSLVHIYNGADMIVAGSVTLASSSTVQITCGTISGPGTLVIPSSSYLYFIDSGSACTHYISNVNVNVFGISAINT
jgi:hypothetical protein